MVILRCGRGSLHPRWLNGARNWDFLACPYQEIPPEPASILPPEIIEGQKWSGLFRLLSDRDGWRRYDYIWLPDDDLAADAASISRLFELSAEFDANISAPALSEDSYFSHPISMRNRSFAARAVTFIEVMMPCFKRESLERVLPVIGESTTGFGWGLDYVWPHLLRYNGLIIFDSVTVRHTRPAGINQTIAAVAPGMAEMEEIVSRAGATPCWRTLGGYSEAGEYRAAEAAGFTEDYLAGYAYLTPGRPELAGWLAAQQDAPVPAARANSSPSLIVALRTHLWTGATAEMARRLAGAAQGAHFVVLADETLATLDTARFEKLAHDDDFAGLGLPNFPHRSVLWYNADYPLYLLRREFPAASHYAMVEYDVAVNIDLYALLRHAAAAGVDLIAHNIRPCAPDWTWTRTAQKHFSQPLQAFFPLLIVSGRAVDHLLARRLAIYRNQAPLAHEDWPFCEAFIPSAIAELPAARIEGLAGHADLAMYRNTFPLHLDQPEALEAGTVSHPVLGGAAFAGKWLKYQNPADIFDPDSTLRRQLAWCAPEDFVEALLRRARAQQPPVDEARLMALAAALGWPAALLCRNLALGRPATQSSVCEWSARPAPELDARGANNGQITGEPGFHTAFEAEPWWQVDLGENAAVARVVIYNRMEFRERCTRMTVSGSADGVEWVLRGAKLDGTLFGGLDGRPYVFRFSPPFPARFVRVTMIGEGFLHFDEVEVFEPGVAQPQGFGQDQGD